MFHPERPLGGLPRREEHMRSSVRRIPVEVLSLPSEVKIPSPPREGITLIPSGEECGLFYKEVLLRFSLQWRRGEASYTKKTILGSSVQRSSVEVYLTKNTTWDLLYREYHLRSSTQRRPLEILYTKNTYRALLYREELLGSSVQRTSLEVFWTKKTEVFYTDKAT